jgi:hypothetical protein
MRTRLDSISGVIISVPDCSVVNHDYKAGSISGVIISVLVSSVYTNDTVQPCNHDLPH